MTTYMSSSDVKVALTLLSRWDGLCVVCGEPFRSILAVTRDHLVPRSRGGKGRSLHDNIAPCHFRCNQVKGHGSLLVAARRVAQRKLELGPVHFLQWLNSRVPGRRLMPDASSLSDLPAFYRRLALCNLRPSHRRIRACSRREPRSVPSSAGASCPAASPE